jgi:hypothetical protein
MSGEEWVQVQVLAVAAAVAVSLIAVAAAAVSLVKWIYRRGEEAGHAKSHHEAESQAQARIAAELSSLKARLAELDRRHLGS